MRCNRPLPQLSSNMPVRLKWYKASPINKKNLDQLLSGFVNDEYSEKKLWGFSNVTLRGAFIEGQYIERSESVIKVTDPFGNLLEFPRINFDKFSFLIGTKVPHLEVQDAPRGINGFLNQLAFYLNFSLAIEPIEIDLSDWFKVLQDNVDSIEVSGALISNISLSNAVSAKISVVGTNEVRPLIKNLTGKYSYVFSKFHVEGIYCSQSFKCDLIADGRANILSGVEEEISEILRRSLAQILRHSEKA